MIPNGSPQLQAYKSDLKTDMHANIRLRYTFGDLSLLSLTLLLPLRSSKP